jgi:hypothetical protein
LTAQVAQPFTVARLNQAWPIDQQRNNTREGYIEAIVAADVPSRPSAMYTAIRHVNDVAPCTASVLDGALLTDAVTEADAAGRGFAGPTGGVAGSWYIIDVAETTTFSGGATAIQAVDATGANARGNYVLFPQTADALATPERYTSDPLLVSAGLASRSKDASGNTATPTTAAVVVAKSYDVPDLSTPYYLPASSLNARITAGDLSKLLETSDIANQYALDPLISAKTDWVLSLPTRRYSVGVDYGRPNNEWLVFSVVSPPGTARQYFHTGNMRFNLGLNSNSYQACISPKNVFGYDRDGGGSNGSIIPFDLNGEILCGATNVMAFYDRGNSALSASVTRSTKSDGIGKNGWFNINVMSNEIGLPILGASFIKLTNPSVSTGVSGTYGIQWPHILSR